MTIAALIVLSAVILTRALVVLIRHIRWRGNVRRRTQIEDALKHLFDQEYRGRHGSFASLSGVLRVNDQRLMQLLGRMQQQGLVGPNGQEFQLTPDGERMALGRSSARIGCSSAISQTRRACRCATSTPLPSAASTRSRLTKSTHLVRRSVIRGWIRTAIRSRRATARFRRPKTRR